MSINETTSLPILGYLPGQRNASVRSGGCGNTMLQCHAGEDSFLSILKLKFQPDFQTCLTPEQDHCYLFEL
jgi:hypothetical protein